MLKAICSCKENSEDDLVLAFPKKAMCAKWGFFMWFIQICLTVFTGFAWLFLLIPYEVTQYFLYERGKYECQFCGEDIPKQNLR